MHNQVIAIIATILLMMTIFVIVLEKALAASKMFKPEPLPVILAVMSWIGSDLFAIWIGILFYRFAMGI